MLQPSPGGLLIATDGTRDSDGAVRVGHALAERDGVGAALLSVVEPMVLYDTDGVATPDIDHLMSLTRESRAAALLSTRLRGAREFLSS